MDNLNRPGPDPNFWTGLANALLLTIALVSLAAFLWLVLIAMP